MWCGLFGFVGFLVCVVCCVLGFVFLCLRLGFFFVGFWFSVCLFFFFNWLAQLLLLTNLGAACIVKVDN